SLPICAITEFSPVRPWAGKRLTPLRESILARLPIGWALSTRAISGPTRWKGLLISIMLGSFTTWELTALILGPYRGCRQVLSSAAAFLAAITPCTRRSWLLPLLLIVSTHSASTYVLRSRCTWWP